MHVKKLYHCAYALSYHLVLVTRYRRRCLDAAMLGDLKGILEEQLQLKGGTLLEFNGDGLFPCQGLASGPSLETAFTASAVHQGFKRRLTRAGTHIKSTD